MPCWRPSTTGGVVGFTTEHAASATRLPVATTHHQHRILGHYVVRSAVRKVARLFRKHDRGSGREDARGRTPVGGIMSGHSKWSTIKHKKAAKDAKRGKI